MRRRRVAAGGLDKPRFQGSGEPSSRDMANASSKKTYD